ncbi:MAG: RpoL/Rpb11 RNA polymerase subunit family protein [Candidatus Acidifodinimicrobium sp.]
MDIEILEKTDDSVKFRVKGGSQSILNLLKAEGEEIEGVSFIGFAMEHPLERSSVLVVKSEGKEIDRIFKKIIDKTLSDIEKLKKEFDSELK